MMDLMGQKPKYQISNIHPKNTRRGHWNDCRERAGTTTVFHMLSGRSIGFDKKIAHK